MYTFETHNTDDSITGNMTSLQGYLDCPKHVLVELFGEPNKDGCEKVINQWALEVTNKDTDEVDVITIYDWKNYWCQDDLDGDFHNWHVGGHNYSAERIIHELIAQLRTK
jgi:hypothetical protein